MTKEQWNNHLSSRRHLHQEVNGYHPDFFPQRKLGKHENIILEKALWKMFLATRDIEELEEFWLIYFMMTTYMTDYILKDIGELRKLFRDAMEGQFEHDLYIKSFSNQLESDETDTLQQKIDWWSVVVDRGGPIPNDIFDCSFAELYNLYRKAIDPEMRDLFKSLKNREIFPWKIGRKA